MTDKNEALQTVHALADVATDEDKLFRDGFVKGVAQFVKECPTPMTIAIQGEWGSGKTSLIKLIEAELQAKTDPEWGGSAGAAKYCEEIISVATIDAWQQSIVNPQLSLLEFLLAEMSAKLAGVSLDTMKAVSKFASAAANVVGSSSGDENREKDDSLLGSVLNWILGSEDDGKAKPEAEFVSNEDIVVFQNACATTLQQAAEAAGKSEDSRFVVFVDGLDYIDPKVVVDFMELVKSCLDCPRCVFVFAVDESTVLSGAGKKLGDKVDEGRKKMLFDRYIQVSLRIPAGACNLDKYIKDLLKDEEELSRELAEVVDTLLRTPTPRRIKRYINAMHLYRDVFGESLSTAVEPGRAAGEPKHAAPADRAVGESLAMLLAAVILKVESVQGFDAVAACAEGDKEQFAENLDAVLEPLGTSAGIDWAKLPTLWSGADAGVDAAKRDAFIAWVRKLK